MNISDETTTDSEKTIIQYVAEPSGDSFLSILDDKNNTIEILKKQVQNQKMQIMFYLQRDLARSKLMELSETCTAQDLDENLPMILAVNEFRTKTGIKSNVHHLYEHMRCIDEKLVDSLQGQEFILKKIVKKICQFLKYNGKIQFKMSSNRLFKNDFCLELFNKLLDATVILRRKLEAFRICCNRLIVLEDERNIIAEQVSSLPVDQKMNCNFIMNIQMEKTKLERKMRQILEKQQSQKEDMEELAVIETKLCDFQKQLNSMAITTGEITSVDDMVRNLDFEAKYLLSMTKHYKQKHQLELATAKDLNSKILDKILDYMHLAIEGKDLANKHLRDRSELELFESIKKPIETAKNELTNELDQSRCECEYLKSELNKLLLERNQLKISNYQLQREFESVKSDHCKELTSLQQQRDTYLAQVEDLQTIREAYTHLVGKNIEEKRPYGNKNLATRNMKLLKKLKIMKKIVNQQQEEILLQHDFINHLKKYSANKIDLERNKYALKYPQVCLVNSRSLCSGIDNKEEYHEEVDEEEILVSKEVYSWEGDENLNVAACITRAPSVGCVAVYSENKRVLKKMVKAMVKEQRSDDDTNTSSFTLEIHESYENEKEEDMVTKMQDDDELMCDYSYESTGAVCHPAREEVRESISKNSSKDAYSRNIQALRHSVNKSNLFSGENCLDYT